MSEQEGPEAKSTDVAQPGIYEELRPLFFPSSVAVVGVSQDTWKPGTSMLRALLHFGFPGRLYPISARGGQLMGLEVYPSVASLPEAADLAFLFVPAQTLPSVVRECREKGVKTIVAFTGGFGETGTEEGRALEAELREQFDGSFRMVGPNCLGVYSPAGGVTQHPGEGYPRESGDVAFVAQSGGLSEDFARATPNFGFYSSKVISFGNALDLNEADLLEYMGADPATSIIGMYVEGARDGRRFADVLRRVAATKPVVLWKGGATPQGAVAASSHTGALAGNLEVWAAVLRQAGVVRVESLEELLDCLAAFHFLPRLADPRIGYVCAGGGNSVVASDACYRAGLTMPPMSPAIRDKIASFLPPVGSTASNPVDVLAPMPSPPVVKGVLEAMAGSGEVGTIILDRIVLSKELRRLMHYASQTSTEDEPWLSEIPIDIQRISGIPVVVVLRENLDPRSDIAVEAERLRLRRYYQDNGIAVYPTPDRAFRALGHVIDYYRRGEGGMSKDGGEVSERSRVVDQDQAVDRARAIIETALARGQKSLSEHEAKKVLEAYGIPITREWPVASADQLAATLPVFEFPVVLKIDSPDILHKTEAGLVALGCGTAETAEAEFHRILRQGAERYPEATINGVLIQEMVADSVAECIVGMKRDPQFGPTLLFGLGGIFVEVFEDVALRVAPLTETDAAAMVRETKGFKLLTGARGHPRADVAAIEDVLLKMSRLALDLEPYLAEIDINPLMVGAEGRGVKAADALILLDSSPDFR